MADDTRMAQLLRFFTPGAEGECWLWQGGINQGGYGRVRLRSVDGRWNTEQAHRAVYEALVGPIPDGLHLDHLCHSADKSCRLLKDCPHRRCVNPAHLEPVTNAENLRRAAPWFVNNHNARKTHCPYGHEYTPENTYRNERLNTRECRICRRVQRRRQKAALRAIRL